MNGTLLVGFSVPGRAQPGGSKVPNKYGGVRDANKKAAPWKATVALVAAKAWGDKPLLDEPLALEVVFMRTRPSGHFNSKGELNKKGRECGWPVGPPDTTKLLRNVEDGLQGVIYRNDSLIVSQRAQKQWGERDSVYVEVRRME